MKKLSELTEKLIINSKSKIINNTTCNIDELADEIIDILNINQTHDTVVDSIQTVLQSHHTRHTKLKSNNVTFKYVDESNCQDYNLRPNDIEWLKVRPSHLISGRARIIDNNYIYKDFYNHKMAYWYFYDTRDGIDNVFIIIANGENVKIFFIES